MNLNVQSFHAELLQPLSESTSAGFNGALLICGAPTEKISALIDHSIIKQVEPKKTKLILILADFITSLFISLTLSQLLADLFSRLLSQVKEELFISVSFLQVCPTHLYIVICWPDLSKLWHQKRHDIE